MKFASRSLIFLILLIALPLQAAPEIESWTTQNGARVMYVNAPAIPMLDIRVVFNAGSARDGSLPGIALMTSNLLNDGAGKGRRRGTSGLRCGQMNYRNAFFGAEQQLVYGRIILQQRRDRVGQRHNRGRSPKAIFTTRNQDRHVVDVADAGQVFGTEDHGFPAVGQNLSGDHPIPNLGRRVGRHAAPGSDAARLHG